MLRREGADDMQQQQQQQQQQPEQQAEDYSLPDHLQVVRIPTTPALVLDFTTIA